jgi:TonB-dependent receptor
MPVCESEFTKRASLLRSGASLLAVCAFAASAPAFAQTPTSPATAGNPQSTSGTAGQVQQSNQNSAPDNRTSQTTDQPATPEDDSAIVVTGIRQSLANSQNLKRNADTVVDAITAQDIGALPDRSVTEALQRVPGVSINRFAGSNDPDHFSVEGSGVVIRGLNFVRSEFNGRDTFSAGVGGQSINFADVPSELLGSVEVYKNTTADMIEGGLAGTVNLNTRLPFDHKGLHFGFDAEANYTDMRKKWTPTGSFLISDTFDTSFGRVGLLADVSYSRLMNRSDGIQVTNFQTRNGTTVAGANNGPSVCRNLLPSNTDVQQFPAGCSATGAAGGNGFADLLPTAYAPLGGQFRTQDYDHKRKGIALAGQWESLDRRASLTAQFLRTDSTNAWGEHTFESAPDLSEYNTYPKGCAQNGNGPGGTTRAECRTGSFTNYIYDANNIFESGYITLPGTGWRNASSGSATSNVPTGGIQQQLSRRQVLDHNLVNDYALNFKFRPTERLSLNLDADYTQARHDNIDMSVFGATFADEELDLRGALPVLIPHKPLTLAATWATPNPRIAGETDAQYFQDPNVQFWRAAMDHVEHSTGHEYAFRADIAYDINQDIPFLKRAKFGARFADRDETVRYTTYNWGAISEIWSGTPVTVQQGGLSNVNFFTFPNFFRGATPGPVGGYYYNGDLIANRAGSADYFKSLNDIWHSLNGATATNRWVPTYERAGVVPGTDFLPNEIQPTDQRDTEAYAMLNFGKDDPIFGSVRLDGNIGLRYVSSDVTSVGSFTIPDQTQLGIQDPFHRLATDPVTGAPIIDPVTGQQATNGRCDPTTPPPPAPQVPVARGGICTIGATAYAQLQQFATGGSVTNIAKNSYHYFLPSLNMKFGVTRDILVRIAASRVLARPDLQNIRNFINIGTDVSNGFQVVATAGNPYLKPALASTFDAGVEWYFARVGSLTVNAFYKDVKNFFYSSIVSRDITNNGVTETTFIRGPANFPGHGKVKGVEVSYQQTFDFLPSFLSGFGVNANYTYIKSKGLPNSYLSGGLPANTSPNGVPGNLPLEQLSKHNFNITAFYEKGPISLRAAYNWRSRFLLTSADVIFPYAPIFNEATGTLDASAFVTLRKGVKIGVQGVNLLNEVTKTSQQFTLSGLVGPRSYFVNDRRFSFILRGDF